MTEKVKEYISSIMAFNEAFVEGKQYEAYKTTKYPSKKLAILSCMDTRLTELLPAALNLKNGDIKIVKNAGAVVSHPFGSVMRSLLIAIYEQNVEGIMVIGHRDCGMQGLEPDDLIGKMEKRNISQEKIESIQYYGVDIHRWLRGFKDARQSVIETVKIIKNHPLVPENFSVYGFMIDPVTGKLEKLYED